MADSTLSAIQTKVRRLTRNPSAAQLSDADLNEYINTFVIYDFPEHLRMFNLRTTFTFYTNPYQDSYPTDELSFAGATDNALYNFQNRYLTVHPPFYIAGYQSFFTQSREQFYGIYPQVNSIASIGTSGDGATTNFTGVINANQALIPNNFQQNIGLLQGEVLFSSVNTAIGGVALVDVPLVDPTTGYKTVWGNLYDPNSADYKSALVTPPTYPSDFQPTNYVNYATGVFNLTFPSAPAAGAPINSQTCPQNASLPQAVLFYDDTFVVRPIPDQPYRVQFEAYIRPTELLESNQSPALEEWWQYIAYGASRKVFQDRLDMDSLVLIEPEYKKQENLILRRTIVQYTNERTATIYTEQTSMGQSSGWGWGGGQF